MFYPDEDYSEIEMYKREFLPMMDDLMKNAKFVPQTVSRRMMTHKIWVIIYDSSMRNTDDKRFKFSAADDVLYSKRAPREGMYDAVMSQAPFWKTFNENTTRATTLLVW